MVLVNANICEKIELHQRRQKLQVSIGPCWSARWRILCHTSHVIEKEWPVLCFMWRELFMHFALFRMWYRKINVYVLWYGHTLPLDTISKFLPTIEGCWFARKTVITTAGLIDIDRSNRDIANKLHAILLRSQLVGLNDLVTINKIYFH